AASCAGWGAGGWAAGAGGGATGGGSVLATAGGVSGGGVVAAFGAVSPTGLGGGIDGTDRLAIAALDERQPGGGPLTRKPTKAPAKIAPTPIPSIHRMARPKCERRRHRWSFLSGGRAGGSSMMLAGPSLGGFGFSAR